MTTATIEQKIAIPGGDALFHGMPGRLKVLYIASAGSDAAWLAEAFAADSAVEIVVEEAAGQTAGAERLRDEVFDAILVSHEPDELDALDLIEGFRAGGAEEPIVVLGAPPEAEMAVHCYEAGADGYVCLPASSTRSLIWIVALAVQKRHLLSENRRFHRAEQARLQREQDEARRLLAEQLSAVEGFQVGQVGSLPLGRQIGNPPHDRQIGNLPHADLPLPDELTAHYRELLRTYVMMGSGNLGDQLRRLARLLVAAGVSARQAVRLHLGVVEEMIQGLGARSGRHVMTRADLLLLEVMMHLGEGYRLAFNELARPPRQKFLPGVEL